MEMNEEGQELGQRERIHDRIITFYPIIQYLNKSFAVEGMESKQSNGELT